MNNNFPLKKTILIITSLLSGFFVFFPIADGDIFWHLAAGREILNSGNFLYTDPFSFTTPLIQWIDLHWLFQVITYLIQCFSGYYGLLILKFLIITAAVFLLLTPIKSLSSLAITAPLFLFCLYHFRYLVPLRPGIFTLLYLSSFFFLLQKYSQNPRIKLLVALIPLQILWNNTQGLFMIGPAVVVLFIAGELTDRISQSKPRLKAIIVYTKSNQFLQLATTFFVLCISGIITPYGIKGLLFPLRLFLQITPGKSNQYSNLIAENTPMFKMIGTDQVFYVLVFALLCAFALFSFLVARGKTRSWYLYLFASFTVLAIMAQRNLILFLFATIPLISFNLQYYPLLLRCKKRVPVHPGSAKVGEGWAVCEDVHVDPAYCGINMNDLENIGREHQNNTFSPVKTDNVFKRVLIYGTVLFISLYFTLVTASHFQMLKSINNPVSPFCHPIKSTHYLTTHSLKGNIFNADRYGGYMLWHLYPSRKVYIDTRLSMRDRAFFSHYISLLDNPSRFPAIADSFTISAVVLPAFIPLYTKLIRYLYYNPDWKLVIADGSEALFVKQEQINTPGINIKDKKVLDSLNQNLQNNLGHNSLQIRFEAGYRLDSFIKNLE